MTRRREDEADRDFGDDPIVKKAIIASPIHEQGLVAVPLIIAFDKKGRPFIPLEKALAIVASTVSSTQRIAVVTETLEYLAAQLRQKEITPARFRRLLRDLFLLDTEPDQPIIHAALNSIDDQAIVASAPYSSSDRTPSALSTS